MYVKDIKIDLHSITLLNSLVGILKRTKSNNCGISLTSEVLQQLKATIIGERCLMPSSRWVFWSQLGKGSSTSEEGKEVAWIKDSRSCGNVESCGQTTSDRTTTGVVKVSQTLEIGQY